MADRTYFVGAEPTVADSTGAYTLDWADNAGLLDQSPNLKRFVEHMCERPAAPPRISEAFAELRSGATPSSRRKAA